MAKLTRFLILSTLLSLSQTLSSLHHRAKYANFPKTNTYIRIRNFTLHHIASHRHTHTHTTNTCTSILSSQLVNAGGFCAVCGKGNGRKICFNTHPRASVLAHCFPAHRASIDEMTMFLGQCKRNGQMIIIPLDHTGPPRLAVLRWYKVVYLCSIRMNMCIIYTWTWPTATGIELCFCFSPSNPPKPHAPPPSLPASPSPLSLSLPLALCSYLLSFIYTCKHLGSQTFNKIAMVELLFMHLRLSMHRSKICCLVCCRGDSSLFGEYIRVYSLVVISQQSRTLMCDQTNCSNSFNIQSFDGGW